MQYPNGQAFSMFVLVAAALTSCDGGCRGWKTEKPPIHYNPNMDTQEKGKAYRKNDFFEDGRWMRNPVEGTVAQGFLHDDPHWYDGLQGGQTAVTFPAQFAGTATDMARGKERFGIYCAPCHGTSGYGNGPVAQKLKVAPPAFHDARLKEMSVGKIYEAIHKGVNNANMPSYAAQLNEQDRWNVVYYVRALQRSVDPSVVLVADLDPDSDGDGLKNSVDNCPTEKGTAANSGCAAAQLVSIDADHIEIKDTVYFKTSSAVIDPRSFPLLKNVASVLTGHTEVKKLSIFGHTDNQGDAAKNLQLSKDRAKAVVDYLVSQGVAAARLGSEGFGDQKPLADNSTDEGRTKNRRVEFTIAK